MSSPVFIGNVHDAALGLQETRRANQVDGHYDGQEVALHPKSKSMIQAAYEMDDYVTDTRVNRDKLVKRDIRDKKKSAQKAKLLRFFVNRLDNKRGTKAYSDYENRMNRLKQQAMNQAKGMGGAIQSHGRRMNRRGAMALDGEDLADFILRDLASEFDEVTDRDNLLEYLMEAEDFEDSSAQDEMDECEKMLQRLEGKDDEKSVNRAKGFRERIRKLKEKQAFSGNFKAALKDAQVKLRKAHGKEIEDGYNIIPKASDLLNGSIKMGGRLMTAIDLASIYRDKILCCENFAEAFVVLIAIARSKYQNNQPSANTDTVDERDARHQQQDQDEGQDDEKNNKDKKL